MSLKRLFQSKTVQFSEAFVLGGIVALFFFQEIIITKKNQEISAVTSQLNQQLNVALSDKSRLQSELTKAQKITKTKIINADGSSTETVTVDTTTQLVTQIQKELEQKYQDNEKVLVTTYERRLAEYSMHKNPKRLDLFVGMEIDRFPAQVYSGGFNYNLWGPFTVGAMVDTKGLIAPMIGIRF